MTLLRASLKFVLHLCSTRKVVRHGPQAFLLVLCLLLSIPAGVLSAGAILVQEEELKVGAEWKHINEIVPDNWRSSDPRERGRHVKVRGPQYRLLRANLASPSLILSTSPGLLGPGIRVRC